MNKEPVRIRQRKLKSGAISLYLDIYYKGKREYEFLGIHLIEEKSKADKEKNKQTMRLAEAIKSKRIIDIVNGTYKLGVKVHDELLFIDYAKKVISTRDKSTADVYSILLYHVERYDKDAILSNLDKRWIEGFQKYLDKYKKVTGEQLNNNTKNRYLSYLAIILKQAVKDELLTNDISIYIDKYKAIEADRNYLTLEEIRKVSNATYEKEPRYRDAFLFSCLTGLRRSDILKLKWKDVVVENDIYRLSYQQQKTEKYEHLDISQQAVKFMGERGKDDELIFKVKRRTYSSEKKFNEWIKSLTGKYITFHCARHSFAVLMISLGVDIYTIQKLLGHSSINTTQIYAKILDKQKQEAVSLIPQV